MKYDVLIVGSGPAGLSASVYTLRAGLSTLIIEGPQPGGLVSTTEQVDNYLGLYETTGVDMAEIFKKHAADLGAEFSFDKVSEISKSSESFFTQLDSGEVIESRTVVYAAGSTPRKLGVPGEELDGVSYCATCDGLFFSDEPVAVVGGGESAFEEALYLSNLASTVDVLVRSSIKASDSLSSKISEKENVRVHLNSPVKEIHGEGSVSEVELESGERLSVQGVFVSIGQDPNSSEAESFVKLYENGYILESQVAGFFIAGDIENPEYRQVIIAAGDGAKAGIDVSNFLL